MAVRWRRRCHCVLAESPSLSPTVPVVALLESLRRRGSDARRGPFLVLASLDGLSRWQRAASQWTKLNAIVYHGSSEDRALMRQHEFLWRGDAGAGTPFPMLGPYTDVKFELLITTYEIAVQDTNYLAKLQWQVRLHIARARCRVHTPPCGVLFTPHPLCFVSARCFAGTYCGRRGKA